MNKLNDKWNAIAKRAIDLAHHGNSVIISMCAALQEHEDYEAGLKNPELNPEPKKDENEPV